MVNQIVRIVSAISPFVILIFCLSENVLDQNCSGFRDLTAVLLSMLWLALIFAGMWCVILLWLSFHILDLWLLVLLLFGIVYLLLGGYQTAVEALILFFGVTLGKGFRFVFKSEGQAIGKIYKEFTRQKLLVFVLYFVVLLLVFAVFWHLDMSANSYHGPRWAGLWDNPNIYGMLMGAGLLLAVGMLASKRKAEKAGVIFLGIAIVMLGVGLVMSYSRGAWLATAVALLYLAWCYGKLKWRYVAVGAGLVALGALFLWSRTPDHAPWYVKRADLGRPSAQNRVLAWRAALEIMRDHPFGVGWNKAVALYGEKYQPPEGGPAALTTNDYLMLGTELGIPALICFIAYVGLCYRKSPRLPLNADLSPFNFATPVKIGDGAGIDSSSVASPPVRDRESEALRAMCLAGALVFVVAFWFDGGLFKLSTAAMFWVLLELGAYRGDKKKGGGELVVK